jgi:hypothetical protein
MYFWICFSIAVGCALLEIALLRRSLSRSESERRAETIRLNARHDLMREQHEEMVAKLTASLAEASENVELQRTKAITAQREQRAAEQAYEHANLMQSVKLEEAEKRADKAEEYAKNVLTAYETALEQKRELAEAKTKKVVKAKSGSELRALNDSENERATEEEISKHDSTSQRS